MVPKYIIIHSHAIKIIDKGIEYTASGWLVYLGFDCHGWFYMDGKKELWVDPTKRAKHAGVSRIGADTNLNRCSIGYEVLIPNCYNYATWRPLIKLPETFTDDLYATLSEQCAKDCVRFDLDPFERMFSHDEVSGVDVRPDDPKVDIGEGFDMYRLKSMTQAEILKIKAI